MSRAAFAGETGFAHIVHHQRPPMRNADLERLRERAQADPFLLDRLDRRQTADLRAHCTVAEWLDLHAANRAAKERQGTSK